LNEVPEQRGHAGEGEHRDGQELPSTKVEVPTREVRMDECPEEVIVVVPLPHKTSNSTTTPALTRFWRRSGCGVAPDATQSGMRAPCGETEWDGRPMR
jgi:hypothetical protein